VREVLAHAFALLQGLQHRGVGVGAGALVAAVLVDALHQRPAGLQQRALGREGLARVSRQRVVAGDVGRWVNELGRRLVRLVRVVLQRGAHTP